MGAGLLGHSTLLKRLAVVLVAAWIGAVGLAGEAVAFERSALKVRAVAYDSESGEYGASGRAAKRLIYTFKDGRVTGKTGNRIEVWLGVWGREYICELDDETIFYSESGVRNFATVTGRAVRNSHGAVTSYRWRARGEIRLLPLPQVGDACGPDDQGTVTEVQTGRHSIYVSVVDPSGEVLRTDDGEPLQRSFVD